MQSDSSHLSPLRVQNEGFLVTSTIERCPKTMMLRELVMNAIEAVADAPIGTRQVKLKADTFEGVRKLCIWNSGQGLSAEELYRVCDLASSLHKNVSLDGNFGMGAKVASLPSNKHGLRYRSCHQGIVSEIVMGQRDGIYGRFAPTGTVSSAHAGVADVTEEVRQAGEYELTADWTEVVLFGNSAGQDTVVDPYASNPSVSEQWAINYLGTRFYRLPPGVSLVFEKGVAGNADRITFRPLGVRQLEFDRSETVTASAGIKVHYGYDPPDGTSTKSARSKLGAVGGMAGIIYKGEIYGLRKGREWVLDGPAYGFPFGARLCSVFVELPDDYDVQPEVYRQFLRFHEGDQAQVMLTDFSGVIRKHIPKWLRQIIESYGPTQADYVGEITAELQDLLIMLGIAPMAREGFTPNAQTMAPAASLDAPPPAATPPADGAAPPAGPTPPPPPKGKPKPAFERPPEIIGIKDDDLIDERALQNRAAKYYPASHQLFVNLTYPSVSRMAAQLRHEFEQLGEPERVAKAADDLAELAITRRVARALVHTFGKKAAGWSIDEVLRAQSPESLSLVADDHSLMVAATRRRMGVALGIDLDEKPDAVSHGDSSALKQRLAGDLAEAQQAARKVLATSSMNPGPILRRVSDIEVKRRNMPAAMEWAEKAVEADPNDPWSQDHLAALKLMLGDLDGAEKAARAALDMAPTRPGTIMRRMSEIELKRKNIPDAMDWAKRAIAADPKDAWSRDYYAGLLLQTGDLDGAERAAREALEQGPSRPGPILRRISDIEVKRKNMVAALDWAEQAIAADPDDPWSRDHLASLLMAQDDLDGAERSAIEALEMAPPRPGPILRRLSDIALKRDNLGGALVWADKAVAADPTDAWSRDHLAGLMLRQGDFEGAFRATKEALDLSPQRPGAFLLRLSEIEVKRKNIPGAQDWAEKAVASNPQDPWARIHLADLLMQQGDLEAAERAALEALDNASARTGPILRKLSDIEVRRGNTVAAMEWAEKAIDADPADAWSRDHLAGLLLQQGDLDGSERAALEAIELQPTRPGSILRRISDINLRRNDLPAAIDWARKAIAADPNDPWSRYHLAGVLMQHDDLDGAEVVAKEALSLAPDRPRSIVQRVDAIESRRREAGHA